MHGVYPLVVRPMVFAVLVTARACLAGEAIAAPAAPADQPVISFQTLRERARGLASRSYQPATAKLPDELRHLNYNDYEAIRFRPEQGPWQNEHLDFTLQFFHPGFLYQDPVVIHLVEEGRVRDFEFSQKQFDYGRVHFPQPLPTGLHFAGLRVLYPLNHPNKQDEVASFIGASYFRILGARQRYGASMRGLAIDTAEPAGEEFPRFTEFWVEKPAVHATFLQVFALLDSPSVAGAYWFVIKPGDTTIVQEEASLFPRKEIKKLGLATLTSMFLSGENRTRFIPDFRPEVHDSDGLLVRTGDSGWLWRPLVNPQKSHCVSRFEAAQPIGFGLLQRDRDPRDYQDLSAHYELRPSFWVQPTLNTGTGAVELVEIPTPNEFHDNVVAYWVPGQKIVPAQEVHWACTLSSFLSGPEQSGLLTVQATRISPPHDQMPPRFVIDFTGDPLGSSATPTGVEAKVQASRGEINNLVVQQNDITGGWRVFFDLIGDAGEETDLRAFLLNANSHRTVSETWIYHYERP